MRSAALPSLRRLFVGARADGGVSHWNCQLGQIKVRRGQTRLVGALRSEAIGQ